MLRLNTSNAPVEIRVGGAVVLCRPPTSSLMDRVHAENRDEVATTAPQEEEAAHIAFAKRVARHAVLSWTGVENEDGTPAEVTPETIDSLVEVTAFFAKFQQEYMLAAMGVVQEGNDFAPSQSGSSETGETTAPPVKGAAQNAPKS